jgi:hypothetical protein
MGISRLASIIPQQPATVTSMHTALRSAVCSVLITNKSESPASVTVYVVPEGQDLDSTFWVWVTSDAYIDPKNTLETFRFPLNTNDTVYVSSSNADTSFSLNAIYESNGRSNITASITEPESPQVGDVWVNTGLNEVNFWDGIEWSSIQASKLSYTANEPTEPALGELWIESDVDLSLSTYHAAYSATDPVNPIPGDLWIESDVDVDTFQQSIVTRWRKILTSQETSFSGLGDNAFLTYTPGYEHVYLNGVLLVRNFDYIASDGSVVTLNQPAINGDVIEIVSITATNLVSLNTYTTTETDAFLSLKAPIVSPTFTGVPNAPTPAQGDNSTQIATTEFVNSELNIIKGSPPAALDSIEKISSAIENDPLFAININSLINERAPINNPEFTGQVVVPYPASNNQAANKLYVDVTTSELSIPYSIDVPLNPPTGKLWVDATGPTLKVWTGIQWLAVM